MLKSLANAIREFHDLKGNLQWLSVEEQSSPAESAEAVDEELIAAG